MEVAVGGEGAGGEEIRVAGEGEAGAGGKGRGAISLGSVHCLSCLT